MIQIYLYTYKRLLKILLYYKTIKDIDKLWFIDYDIEYQGQEIEEKTENQFIQPFEKRMHINR